MPRVSPSAVKATYWLLTFGLAMGGWILGERLALRAAPATTLAFGFAVLGGVGGMVVATAVNRLLLMPILLRAAVAIRIGPSWQIHDPGRHSSPGGGRLFIDQQDATLTALGFEPIALLAHAHSPMMVALFVDPMTNTRAEVHVNAVGTVVALACALDGGRERVTASACGTIMARVPPPFFVVEVFERIDTRLLLEAHNTLRRADARLDTDSYRQDGNPLRSDPIGCMERDLERTRAWDLERGALLRDDREEVLRLSWHEAFRSSWIQAAPVQWVLRQRARRRTARRLAALGLQ